MNAVVKGTLYLGCVLLLGCGVFARWIGPEVATGTARRRLRIGLFAGALLLAAGSVIDVVDALTRAVGIFDLTLVTGYLAETRHGNAVLLRLTMILGLLLLGDGGTLAGVVDRFVYAGVAAALLATFSLTSHAAGLGGLLPVLADLVHLAGAAVWAGVVLALAWLPARPADGRADAPLITAVIRVSRIGLVSVQVMALTGAYAAALHLWGPAALGETPYGRALLVKLAAVAVVLAIAGVNRWVLVPEVALGRWPATFRHLVRVESLLLVVVLGITGVLVTRPLPGDQATVAEVIPFRERVGPWIVRGSLNPAARAGFDLEFSMFDLRGMPPEEPVAARIVLTMQDHPMPPAEVWVTTAGQGSYRAKIPLPMAGRWRMGIFLPAGAVTVDLAAKGVLSPGVDTWWRFALGALLALTGSGLAFRVAVQTWMRTRQSRVQAGAALAVAIAGVLLAAPSVMPSPDVGLMDRQSPIPATPASVMAGERVYRQHCQACHGATGAGDGPAAVTLRPRPVDLRVHLAAGHTDGQLFLWISEGFKGTAMPGFKGRLSEEGHWHVVNFIRTFATTPR